MPDFVELDQFVESVGSRSKAARLLGVTSETIRQNIKLKSAVVIAGEMYVCRRIYAKNSKG